MSIKDRILKGWSLRRFLYLGMGIVVIGQAFLTQQYFLILFGVYFASMGIFNFGCASGACAYIPPPRTKEESTATEKQ